MIGPEIGNFRILEKLGEGAMGVVYRAEDLSLRRPVALKFLSPRMVSDREARDRLVQEARAAAALRHEAVCTVYETGEVEGQAYIAMELCTGQTLQEHLGGEPLDLQEALDLMIRIAEGLAHAHAGGVVHRDLKPPNIMIVPGRGPVLMDFGLARRDQATQLTVAGTTLGTAAYMSPEQSKGEPVDHRTDIWACGVMLYEMLAGRRPFTGDYEAAVVYHILSTEPEPLGTANPQVPYGLEQIVGHCLAKDPQQRYATAGDLARDLKVLRSELTAGRRPERFIGVRRFLRRPRAVAGAVLGLVLAAAAIGTAVYLSREQAIDSIAVLPFANLSGQQDQEFFTEGLTEQLITELQILGANSGLRVIGRTSVMRYRNSDKSLPEIARELDVDALVEASVIRSAERILVTAKLIRARPERQIWADQFERTESDVLKLNALLAGTIADRISLGVEDESRRRLTRTRSIDPKAYEAYLQGRHLFSRTTPASVRGAIDRYEECIALEPDYAPAHAHLAEAIMMLAQIEPRPPSENWPRAAASIRRALEIDENDSDAHAIMSDVLKWGPSMDFAGAWRQTILALELNPSNTTALLMHAQNLVDAGREGEARVLLEKAVSLDPYDAFVEANMVYASGAGGDLEEARKWYDRTLESDPNSLVARWGLGMALLAAGQVEESARILREGHDRLFSVEDGSPETLPQLLLALAALGRTGEIEALRADLDRARERRYMPAIFFACLDAALGDEAGALDELDRAVQEQDFRLTFQLDTLQMLLFGEGEPSPRFRAVYDPVAARKRI